MIRFTAEIEPTGTTAERRLESLITQLRAQNEQLRAIFADEQQQNEKMKAEIAELRQLIKKEGT